MHYEVDYTNCDTDEDRDARAITDCREWLGDQRFVQIDTLYRQKACVPLDLFRLQLSFAGIGGFPVAAWHRSLWPDSAAEDHTQQLNTVQ
jgi:hypothetical protein